MKLEGPDNAYQYVNEDGARVGVPTLQWNGMAAP